MKPSGIVVAVAALGWVLYKRKELGRVEIGFWLFVALGGVIYGTGLVAPPNFEKLFEDIGTTLGKWTYLLVGALAYLETGAFIGLIAPGETTILFGGFVAGQGKISLVVLLAIVWGAALAGDVTSYFLGRRLGREFLVKHGPKVKITEDRLEKVEGFFQKYGGSAILLGRFVGLVRAIAPFIAGSSRLPFRRFIVFDIIGTGIWGCGLVLLGYVFWQSFDKLLKVAKQGLLGLAVFIVVVVGIVALVRFLRDDERREEARRSLEAHAIGRHVILPAGRLGLRLVPSFAAIQLATLAAIGLVGGFTFGAFAHAVNDGHDAAHGHGVDEPGQRHRDGRPRERGQGADVAGLPAGRRAARARHRDLPRRPADLRRQRGARGRHDPRGDPVQRGQGGDRPPAPARRSSSTRRARATRRATPPTRSRGSRWPSRWPARCPGIGRRASLVTAALVVAVVIGGTRVYLQVHYASDVLGGWGLGLACYSLCGLVVVAVAFLRQNAGDARAADRPGSTPGSDPSPS